MPLSRTDRATVDWTRVRAGGKPLCTTTASRSLETDDGVYADYRVRAWAAERLALCWNACRHLTDEQLRALATKDTAPER